MKHAEERPGIIELPTRPRNTRKLPVQPDGAVLLPSQEVKLLPERAASKQEQGTPLRVKVGDWVTCRGSVLVGCVKRMARDGRWADVNWYSHVKRMQTAVLEVQTTIRSGDWLITDMERERERTQGEKPSVQASRQRRKQ